MPDLYKSSSTAQKFKGGKTVIMGINKGVSSEEVKICYFSS
jgi:hypothetical protein